LVGSFSEDDVAEDGAAVVVTFAENVAVGALLLAYVDSTETA
jgi:hypothetical protein